MAGLEVVQRIGVTLVVAATALAAVAAPTQAQTGADDVPAWCRARLDITAAATSQDRKALDEAMDRFASTAPSAVSKDANALTKLYRRRGDRAFDSRKGRRLVASLDSYVSTNCRFPRLSVTALDYRFENVPVAFPAGATVVSLTNAALREDHEFVVYRLKTRALLDPLMFFRQSEKRIAKQAEFEGATFVEAGETGVSVLDLEAGDYVAACFLPVGGKKKGAPHFTRGMVAAFTID